MTGQLHRAFVHYWNTNTAQRSCRNLFFFFFPPFLKVCSTIMDHCWIYVITLTSVGVIRNRKTMAKQGQTQALVILVGNGMVPAERTHVSVCACVCLCCAWVLIWVMRKERLEKLTVAAVCCFSTHPLSSGCGAVKVFMWVCDTPRCSKRLHLFCQRDLRVRSVYRAPRRSLALWPACVRKLFVLISQRFFQLCGSVLWKKREERRRWGERDSWPSNSITSAARWTFDDCVTTDRRSEWYVNMGLAVHVDTS